MAGSMNRVTLVGNLGQAPEIRSTQSGDRVASFSIATSESWNDKRTGERQERTEWHRVVVWNEGLVGVVEKYLNKGDKVLIEGMLKTRKWVDQSGNERYTTEVVLGPYNSQLIMLGSPQGGGSNGERPAGRRAAGHTPAPAGADAGAGFTTGSHGDLDDEIPF